MADRKRGSERNAIKHGVFAGTLLSGPGSVEEADIQHLLSGARLAIRPTNPVEEALTEMFAFLILRWKRANKADLEIAPELFARVKDFLTPTVGDSFLNLNLNLNANIVRNEKTPTMDSLIRYQTSIVRQMGRILSLIQQLRQIRVIEAVPTSLAPDPSEGPSSIPSQDPELHSG